MLAPIVLLLGLAATLNGCGSQQASGAPILKKTGLPFMGSDIPTPYAGANFALHDHRGRTYTLNQFRGRVVLVTFLYTHCPDTCPLITEALNQALRDLGSTRQHVRVLAVSVDPKGDTAASVKAYRKAHRLLPQFRYLIGTRSELLRVWRKYEVEAVASDPEHVDHSAYTVLIDQSGKARVLYDWQIKPRAVVHDVRLLLG
jgi:protein SCO1/2